MNYIIIPANTELAIYPFIGYYNTVFVIRYGFNLDGHTIYTIGPSNYLLFDGGTITNGTIHGRTLDGIVRPEWFGAKGNAVIDGDGNVTGTDDTDAIEMALRFTELYIFDTTNLEYIISPHLRDYIHNLATIEFNGTSKYILKRSLYLRLGVSVNFNGCTLLPMLEANDNVGFSSPKESSQCFFDSYPFILYVNWNKINEGMCFEYPPRLGSISNVKVGLYKGGEPNMVLGFIYLAAPMVVHDIFTSHICPVVCTPDGTIQQSNNTTQTCYLDAVSISRITAVWPLYSAPVKKPAIPFIIHKRSHGDAWRIEQLSNECGGHCKNDKVTPTLTWIQYIYGIYFDQTFGLTITNCIHADGVIWRCTDVEYVGNHNERLSLFVNYSNIAIRNCYFVSASDTKASLVLQENNSNFKPCANTVVLDNITFVIANHSRSYGDFYPQIAIGDNGFPIIEYRDVKTNLFSPSIGDFAMRPTTGFTFSHGGNIYVSHFRRGVIDLTGNTVDVKRGNVLGPVTGTFSATAEIINSNLANYNDNDEFIYSIKLFNKIASNCYVSVAINDITVASSQNVGCICIRMTPHFADGYAVYVKRQKEGTSDAFAILPLSYNGILVDWGNWINGVPWVDNDPLTGYTSLTMKSNEHIEFGLSGHVRYYVNNIFKALPWASPTLELVDVENPLQTCFTEEDGDRRCYSHQSWAYIRPTTSNVYHVSLGYPSSPTMYQDQIYTIRNGFDDSVVEIRISFPQGPTVKTVKGKDFVTAYVDGNRGLYLKFNSSHYNCDIAVQCNQVNNLVTMVNETNTFPDKPYIQWTGLTTIATSAPSGTTSGRPTNAAAGTYYFDTTIGKPIWSKGNNQWTDANGIIR